MSYDDLASSRGVFDCTYRIVNAPAANTIDKGTNVKLPILMPRAQGIVHFLTTTSIVSTSIHLTMMPNINKGYTLGIYLSLLFFNLDVIPANFSDICKSAGFIMELIYIGDDGMPPDTDPIIVEAFSQPMVIDIDTHFVCAISSVLIPLMGKQPTEQGYSSWWSSCCKAAEGRFNFLAAVLISLQPPRKQAGTIYSGIMGSFVLHKAVFTALVDYRRAHSDKVSDFIDVTLALLKNTGMTHFVLIDKYLVTPNQPALMSEKAKPHIDNLIQAYTYLKGVADDQKNYLKFLKSDDELGVFNQQKFKNVRAIAYHSAIKKEPSLSNYSNVDTCRENTDRRS
uniref:Uncharacterized protein n=1 Tax=Romanomermis culicivorax TaxID=13658 RepID=A0A915JC63_ROMCU